MFEKEAEEWVKENMDCCKTDNCLNESIPYFSEEERCTAKSAFKDGAEFGYNKANKWHFVKDGLPKISSSYLVFTGGKPFILDYDTEAKDFGYWCLDVGDNLGVRDTIFETVAERDEDKVIAWKELPEPPKER